MDRHAQGQPRTSSSGDDGNERRTSPAGSSLATDPVDFNSRDPSVSSEEQRPPLPPRPNTLNLLDDNAAASSRAIRKASQSNLQAKATTAVSLTDIGSQQNLDGPKENLPIRNLPGALRAKASLSQVASSKASEAGDSVSARSSLLNPDVGEVENVFNDFIATEPGGIHQDSTGLLQFPEFQADDVDDDFTSEFEPVGEVDEAGENEELVLERWKAKKKHCLIISAAGKPIWTRHGDGGLISTYVGVIQTIISFYEDAKDSLSSFTAGDTKFVILTKGPLYLVAISQLLESENQLKLQLEAFYMQILSTLTLPSLSHLFSVRPSTDLKRPLQGTESLLSTLADSFTKGSPSTLLSALECLKIRKAHRQTINNALLKTKASSLLYGLVVAGGRLVSVVRPKKHSLHPGDLQLLFNMIFEAEGVKAGGGESWIPVCLPGFNSTGYLYMYVSFLDLRDETSNAPDEDTTKEESVAIILISTNKESFFELQEMRNALVEQMERTDSIKIIKAAVDQGRPSTTDIVPGTVLHHFLYKSKANVQFAMSAFDPDFSSVSRRRRLMSTYNNLHASIHAKHTHVRVHHCVSHSATSFAWVTPLFELYCVAGPKANRNALAQSASKIVQWVRKEEERLFIIGGAVAHIDSPSSEVYLIGNEIGLSGKKILAIEPGWPDYPLQPAALANALDSPSLSNLRTLNIYIEQDIPRNHNFRNQPEDPKYPDDDVLNIVIRGLMERTHLTDLGLTGFWLVSTALFDGKEIFPYLTKVKIEGALITYDGQLHYTGNPTTVDADYEGAQDDAEGDYDGDVSDPNSSFNSELEDSLPEGREALLNGNVPNHMWRTQPDPQIFDPLMKTMATALLRMPHLQNFFFSIGWSYLDYHAIIFECLKPGEHPIFFRSPQQTVELNATRCYVTFMFEARWQVPGDVATVWKEVVGWEMKVLLLSRLSEHQPLKFHEQSECATGCSWRLYDFN